MQTETYDRLIRLERECNITIPFAVESGSRVYGFDSADSDYDIRGIYIQPLDNYLKISKQTEQLDFMEDNKDFVLWDIRKAVKLLTESNPNLLDWTSSPTKYLWEPYFVEGFTRLAMLYYSPGRYFQANFGLAKGHYNKYIKGKDKVEHKVYLYTLRALAACKYTMKESFAPPVDFKFQDEFNYNLNAKFIEELIAKKKSSSEKEFAPTNSILNALILDTLTDLEEYRKGFEYLSMNLTEANDFLIRQLIIHKTPISR
jgi:uncharacterized protein